MEEVDIGCFSVGDAEEPAPLVVGSEVAGWISHQAFFMEVV